MAGKTIGTKMLDKIKENIGAALEIIELCAPIDLKEREAFYLDKFKHDDKMISWEHGAWKPVLQYTNDGVFVKKHFSIGSAARYVGAEMKAIQRVLSGKRNSYKGMTFIFEHDYHKRRKEIVRERSKYRNKKMGRKIVMIDGNGSEVRRFNKIADAIREFNCVTIRSALAGIQKSAMGHTWKYVDD